MTVPVDLNVERVHEISAADNRAAVCAVLRWAARTRAGEPTARGVCEVLGLDLGAVLGASGPEHGPPSGEDPPAPDGAVHASRSGPVFLGAQAWLRAYLMDHRGAATVAEITAAAGDIASISTLRAARDHIGATSRRGPRGWSWVLPVAERKAAERAPGERCGTYAGWRYHVDHGDGQPCEPCREAKRAYVRAYRARREQAG